MARGGEVDWTDASFSWISLFIRLEYDHNLLGPSTPASYLALEFRKLGLLPGSHKPFLRCTLCTTVGVNGQITIIPTLGLGTVYEHRSGVEVRGKCEYISERSVY